jgi:hypothetical protein
MLASAAPTACVTPPDANLERRQFESNTSITSICQKKLKPGVMLQVQIYHVWTLYLFTDTQGESLHIWCPESVLVMKECDIANVSCPGLV